MSSHQFTTVREYLLEECDAFEYILLGDLRDLLEEPADDLTCKWLIAVLDALLQTLPREFELQDEGGYLAEVLEEFPNWSGHVDQLLEERELLFQKLHQFRERIAQQVSFGSSRSERLDVEFGRPSPARTAPGANGIQSRCRRRRLIVLQPSRRSLTGG